MKKNNTVGAIFAGIVAGAIAGGVVKGVTVINDKIKKKKAHDRFVKTYVLPTDLQKFKEASDRVFADYIKRSVESMDELYTKECEFVASCDKIFPVVCSLGRDLDELMTAVSNDDPDIDEISQLASRYYNLKEEVLRNYDTYKLDEDEDCFVDESIEEEWDKDPDENTTERIPDDTGESDKNGTASDGDQISEDTGEPGDTENQSEESEGREA